MDVRLDWRPRIGARGITVHDGRGRWWIAGFSPTHATAILEVGDERLQRLYLACDGERTPAALAALAGLTVDETLAALSSWGEKLAGTIEWIGRSYDERSARLRRLGFQLLKESTARAANANTSDYYRDGVTDALEQFDRSEPTVAHAYSSPHAALAGRSYGAAFFDAVRRSGALSAGNRILEIGCGTGRFARAFLDRMRDVDPACYRDVRYTLFELSETLAASQRQLCAAHADRVSFVAGDVERYAFADTFDLIVANEMIADLSVEERDGSLINSGAIALVEKLPSLLAPGGYAALTEYGSTVEPPMPVKLPGHIEHSIHFGHLLEAAERVHLEARCLQLVEYLGFDAGVEVLSRHSLHLLQQVSPALLGPTVPSLSYDRAQLAQLLGEALDRIGNLFFLPVANTDTFMSPAGFLALELRA